MFALTGRPIEAERWTAAAERAPRDGVLADGSTMESLLAYLRVNLCRDGLDRMRADAQRACDGLAASSPYRATMLNAEGIAALHEGDLDAADPIFVRAYDAAMQAGALPLEAMVRAERALVAIERERWSDAEELVRGALDMVAAGDLDDYWTSALVFAVAGARAVHRGRLDRRAATRRGAARLRPLLTYALPNLSVQTLLELARVYAALGDTAGASAVLRELRDIVQQRPRPRPAPRNRRTSSAPDSTRAARRPSARRRSRTPSSASRRTSRRTSRSRRSPSGCTCRATR